MSKYFDEFLTTVPSPEPTSEQIEEDKLRAARRKEIASYIQYLAPVRRGFISSLNRTKKFQYKLEEDPADSRYSDAWVERTATRKEARLVTQRYDKVRGKIIGGKQRPEVRAVAIEDDLEFRHEVLGESREANQTFEQFSDTADRAEQLLMEIAKKERVDLPGKPRLNPSEDFVDSDAEPEAETHVQEPQVSTYGTPEREEQQPEENIGSRAMGDQHPYHSS